MRSRALAAVLRRHIAAAAAPAPFNPLAIAGCKLWLDSSDVSTFTFGTGSLVAQWADKSGNGNNAVQASTSSQPSRSGTQNGLATVEFDGLDDFLPISMAIGTDSTVFAVVANRRTTIQAGVTIDTVFATDASNAANRIAVETSNAFVSTTQRQVVTEANTGTVTTYKNGATSPLTLNKDEWTVITYTVAGGATSSAFWLGVFTNSNFFGANGFGGALLYDSVLGTTDRQTVEAGLRSQWAI